MRAESSKPAERLVLTINKTYQVMKDSKLTTREVRYELFHINSKEADELRIELFDIREQDAPLPKEYQKRYKVITSRKN